MPAHLESPCRVSADLRCHEHDQAKRFPPNDKRIEDARGEIVAAILSGKGWRGHVLTSALEQYLNVTPPTYYTRLAEAATRLQFLATQPLDTLTEVQKGTADWLRGIVEAYVQPQWIEDRAAELARED